ncbi:MAG: hypothetical protein KAH32_01990 [Chlamydiia bacterium]|nr:hypothetical protein [Chlamydiia bacterium]
MEIGNLNVSPSINSASANSNVNNVKKDDSGGQAYKGISNMNPAQLRVFFSGQGVVGSVGAVLDFLSDIRDSVLTNMSVIINNSKKRQQAILKKIKGITFAEVAPKSGDSADKKRLEMAKVSSENTQKQKIIDDLNNQLSLEKTFIDRASQVTDRLQATAATLASFYSSIIRNYQSGVQSIVK